MAGSCRVTKGMVTKAPYSKDGRLLQGQVVVLCDVHRQVVELWQGAVERRPGMVARDAPNRQLPLAVPVLSQTNRRVTRSAILQEGISVL